MRQRREIERRRPGIVDQRDDAARAGDGGDRRDILHLERQGTGGFEEDGPCGGRDRIGDTRACQRIVEAGRRSEEHTSELQSLMRISYAVFCLKKKTTKNTRTNNTQKKSQYE